MGGKVATATGGVVTTVTGAGEAARGASGRLGAGRAGVGATFTWPMSWGIERGAKLAGLFWLAGWIWMVPAGRTGWALGVGGGRAAWGRGVGEKRTVVAGARVVALWPVGAALLLVLIWAPPGRFCWREVWKTPVFWLKDSWLSNWF